MSSVKIARMGANLALPVFLGVVCLFGVIEGLQNLIVFVPIRSHPSFGRFLMQVNIFLISLANFPS